MTSIIFDQNKINEGLIINYMNNIHKYLEFKSTKEEKNNITFLDLSIQRNNNDLHLGINRKLTQIDTTIRLTSNHPLEHKLAAYIYINRTITLPIMEQAKQQEWNIILTVAKYNGCPLQIIHKLKNKITLKTQKRKSLPHKHNKRRNGSLSHITFNSYTR